MSSHYAPAPAPKKNSSAKTILIVLSVFGIMGFLGLALLAGGVFYFVSQARNDSDELVLVNSTDRVSTILLPSNWAQFPPSERNADASIQYANLFAERYVMVISESKSDLNGLLDTSSSNAISAYNELVQDGLAAALTIKRDSQTEATINGMPGFRCKLSGDVDGVDIVYWVSVVEGKNDFHQVHVWTTAALETKNKPILFNVANSFKEAF
jgi:hypothetical protein